MRMLRPFYCFIGICSILMFFSILDADQQKASTNDPKADEVLLLMSDYLNSLKQFTIHIENTTEHLLNSGQKIQLDAAVDVSVRRPNRFRVDREGHNNGQQLFYDGQSLTLYAIRARYYATIKVPPTLEEALDFARESFGIVAPAADVVAKNSYDILMENVISGRYIERSKIRGIECHHLLFSQDEVDWQIWIENSKTPLPRKMVITEKLMTGGPQFTAFFSSWTLSTQLQDDLFFFVPPEGAEQIEFLPKDKNPESIK
jgi:hypothetical protein